MKKIVLSLLAVCIANLSYGWGQKGHDVVAYIAEQHLTEATKDAVDSIFDGKSLVYWANWLDNASHTPSYKYAKTWHYKNVDADVDYHDAPVIESGNIITALNAEVDSLKNGMLDTQQSQIALRIVVHLIGDLHQPMHFGRLTDIGGNQTTVIYFKRTTNLHTIWDTNLVEDVHRWSYSEWQDQLDRLKPCQEAEIIMGTYDDWGKETHSIACEIYDTTPLDQSLEYSYGERWRETIEQQLLKGGLRLAHVLNSIFDPEYKAPCCGKCNSK